MTKKHIAIIGAGAAGMSCAATLAQHPDKFKVTVIERANVAGGQATSIPLDRDRFGASWMNNGVQGGSKIFKHTINFFTKYNREPREVELQISFGKGPQGFWTNCFPSSLVDKFSADIKKFGVLLKVIKWTMPILGLVPIRIMLRLFSFSKDFGDRMVYPLIALFLGTGNQTANVPCALAERLFQDPNMKLWDYDPNSLLPNLPVMMTFDNLDRFYDDWRNDLAAKGVEFRLGTEVSEIVSRSHKGIILRTRQSAEMGAADAILNDHEIECHFDDLVLCILADHALRLLGKTATAREKLVLGSARFYDDLTVTHSDSEYFNRHYETVFRPSLCAEPRSDEQERQVSLFMGDQNGSDAFRPMYYTKTYECSPAKIEMSFDCSNYQHQLIDANTCRSVLHQQQGLPHVYQTIFLDKTDESSLWTRMEIDASKIIQEKWWHQVAHRWQHYLKVVPWMMFLNGRNRTFFAGSWTLVNMHEIACVSGIAAAYRLGADYHKFDDFAEKLFEKYLFLSHGMMYSREEKRRRKTATGKSS